MRTTAFCLLLTRIDYQYAADTICLSLFSPFAHVCRSLIYFFFPIRRLEFYSYLKRCWTDSVFFCQLCRRWPWLFVRLSVYFLINVHKETFIEMKKKDAKIGKQYICFFFLLIFESKKNTHETSHNLILCMALFSVGHKRLPCTCPHVYDGLCLIVLHSFCAFWDFRWIQPFFPLCTVYKRTIQLRLHLKCSSQKISLFLFWILGLFVIKPYSIVMNPKKNSFGLRAAIHRMENQLNLGFFGTFFGTSFSSFSNYFFEFTTFWGRKKFHP